MKNPGSQDVGTRFGADHSGMIQHQQHRDCQKECKSSQHLCAPYVSVRGNPFASDLRNRGGRHLISIVIVHVDRDGSLVGIATLSQRDLRFDDDGSDNIAVVVVVPRGVVDAQHISASGYPYPEADVSSLRCTVVVEDFEAIAGERFESLIEGLAVNSNGVEPKAND